MRRRRRTGSERGQAIVELALTLPLLLLIVLGVFDFGLMFQRYEVVTSAAREGARVGALPEYSAGLGVGDQVPAAVARAAEYLRVGGIDPDGQGVVISAMIESSTGTTPPVTQIRLIVEYPHQHIFVGPIMSMFGGSFGTTTLQGVSVMRMEAT